MALPRLNDLIFKNFHVSVINLVEMQNKKRRNMKYLFIVAGITDIEVLGIGPARSIGVGRAGRRAPGGRNRAGSERAARWNTKTNRINNVTLLSGCLEDINFELPIFFKRLLAFYHKYVTQYDKCF